MKVKLERIKTKAGREWAARRLDRLVYIIGEGWFWRKERSGYTDQRDKAGIYTLADALNASAHCGPEKHIVYEFLPIGEWSPTQEPRGPAILLLGAA